MMPMRAEQRQHHGQLEGDAEGEDQRHDQRQIFADLRQQLDGRLPGRSDCCMPSEKRITIGMAKKIDHQRAEHEEHRRRDQIGREGVALVLVEARRDELVDLRRDHGKREEAAPNIATLICVKKNSSGAV